MFSAPSPLEYLDVYVTYLRDGAGDSRLGGPMRIKSRLDHWTEMRTTAGHELVHVLRRSSSRKRQGPSPGPSTAGGMPSSVSAASIVKGFNVYRNGVKINTRLLSSLSRTFSDARILAGSDVTVTVVDASGNEWPEVLPKALPTTCTALVELAERNVMIWNDPYNVEHFGYPRRS